VRQHLRALLAALLFDLGAQPRSCRLVCLEATYKRSDLRTRRIPTEPLMATVPAPEARPAAAIDAQNVLGADKKTSERT
jgi:hypothetical protein